MFLLLTAACADLAFTLGGDAALMAAADTGDTGGETGGGTGGDDTAADTSGDTAPDTASESGSETGSGSSGHWGAGLPEVYELGDVIAVPVAAYADWISPGDVNGDGLADLVASVYNVDSWTYGNLSHDFELVLSDGAGGYTITSVAVGLLGDNPMPTVVADFDGDGRGDLAVATVAGLTLFRFDGKTLADRVDFTFGPVRVIRAADLDNDGDVDLVGLTSDEAVVWTNDGSGTFTELSRLPTLNGSADRPDENTLRLYDFDSDGILDLFCTGDQWYGVPVQVNLGVGDGTFGAAITSFPDAQYMLDTFVADYDGDGVNEVAFLDAAWLQLNVGEWTGTVSSVATYHGPLYGSSWVVPADVDGDGDGDLIGIDGFNSAVLQQESAGMTWRGLFPVINYELLATTGNQVFVASDANSDGCDDLFVYDFPEGYRLAPSQASGCAGAGGWVEDAPDTGGDTAADTAGETADTGGTDTSVSSFASAEDSRTRHGCTSTGGQPLGAVGVLLAALAARRRRA